MGRVIGWGLKEVRELICVGSDAAKGTSFSEEAGNRAEKFGRVLSKKEIEGMREVCRVSAGVVGGLRNGADGFAPRSSDARCWILPRRRSDLESRRSRLTRLCTTHALSATLTPVLWATDSSPGASARMASPPNSRGARADQHFQIRERGHLPWCLSLLGWCFLQLTKGLAQESPTHDPYKTATSSTST